MMKNYTQPEIQVVFIGSEDIMLGSDAYIDVSDLWSDEEEN